jgi:hypothetical protein
VEQLVLNQNLKNAKEDLMQGRLTLQQATSKWDVTSKELLNYIQEEDSKDEDTGRQDSTMAP